MSNSEEYTNYANGLQMNRMLKEANNMRRRNANPYAANNSEEFKKLMSEANAAREEELLETPGAFTHMVNKADQTANGGRRNRKSRKNRRDRKTRRQRINRKSRMPRKNRKNRKTRKN